MEVLYMILMIGLVWFGLVYFVYLCDCDLTPFLCCFEIQYGIHVAMKQDGEDVEFNVEEANGRRNAMDVTGPDGAYVIGKPFRPRYESDMSGGDGGGY